MTRTSQTILCFLFCMPVISSPHRRDLKKKKIRSHRFSPQNPTICPIEPEVLRIRPSSDPCLLCSLCCHFAPFWLFFRYPKLVPCHSLSFVLLGCFFTGFPNCFTSSDLCSREEGRPWPSSQNSPHFFLLTLLYSSSQRLSFSSLPRTYIFACWWCFPSMMGKTLSFLVLTLSPRPRTKPRTVDNQ